MSVDTKRIEAAVLEILEAVGEDPTRDGLLMTPSRVARMYEELFVGFHENPADHLEVTFDAGHDEMVMVRDIPFASLCEHHMVPFMGRAHVAYIPGSDGRITGLSKLARLVDGFARRLQVQERMTAQIADAIEAASRSLEKITPGNMEDLVRDVIDSKLQDGQLDACDLTMAEINTIRRVLIFTLSNILHGRIAYPTAPDAPSRTPKPSVPKMVET